MLELEALSEEFGRSYKPCINASFSRYLAAGVPQLTQTAAESENVMSTGTPHSSERDMTLSFELVLCCSCCALPLEREGQGAAEEEYQ